VRDDHGDGDQCDKYSGSEEQRSAGEESEEDQVKSCDLSRFPLPAGAALPALMQLLRRSGCGTAELSRDRPSLT
jgi:hypothetical protein